MEELRIKCPSCGIILDVKNSKNEAVKRITCPNCKKQLAVTFRDEPQPAQFVEMKMVQLADGSTKTIIRALTDDHVIKVNGEELQKDDEVVLSVGDELEIDGKVSVFGKQQVHQQSITRPTPTATSIPTPPSSQKSNKQWVLYVVAALVGVLIAFAGWRIANNQQTAEPTETVQKDTIVPTTTETVVPENPESKPKQEPKQKQKSAKEEQPAKTNKASLSNYELEKMAMSGDVEAQYQLGKRWVSRHDSINVVKGIKYLKLAVQNGSSEARSALNKVYRALEQSAANGSRTAGNILREQR